MIKVEDALEKIFQEVQILGAETVDILASLNKVLAEDIYAKENLPPFDKSAMDGYAIKSQDTLQAGEKEPVRLLVKGIIKAGDYSQASLETGQAVKIMTGAPLPPGADAIIEVEKVQREQEELLIYSPVEKGYNVIELGEEIRAGELALLKGRFLRPAEIGLLASLGYQAVQVYRAPRAALLITGDELVDIEEKLTAGKIRNSNEYSLQALLLNARAQVLSFGIIPDDLEILREKVKAALEEVDLVISTGGASVGDYDFMEEILRQIGAEIKFDSVAIKPGKPMIFATYKNKLFFGLPGNPSAVINTFEQFIKPTIEKMLGKDSWQPQEFPVILLDDFKAKKGRRHYVYVGIKKEDGIYYAGKVGSQSSSQLMTVSKANGVIIIPEEQGTVRAGETVQARFLFS